MSGSTGSGGEHDDVVVRKAEHGWVVGGETASDLTSAMVLADLLAADNAAAARPGAGSASLAPSAPAPRPSPRHAAPAPRRHTDPGPLADTPPSLPRHTSKAQEEADEAARLAVTVAQLEHALASRVSVEQAIGVLAERHRLRPRQAFDLMRGAARSRGLRVTDVAHDVVASAANPLLQLPDELARTLPAARPRGRSLRRARQAEHPHRNLRPGPGLSSPVSAGGASSAPRGPGLR